MCDQTRQRNRQSEEDEKKREDTKKTKKIQKNNFFFFFLFSVLFLFKYHRHFQSALFSRRRRRRRRRRQRRTTKPRSLLEPRVNATRDTKRRGLEEAVNLYICARGKKLQKTIICCKRAAFAQKGRARKKRDTSKRRRRRRRWANKNQRLYVSCVANLTSFRNDLGKSSRTSSHLCKKTNGSVRFFYRTTSTPNESISRAVCGARKCITTTKKND